MSPKDNDEDLVSVLSGSGASKPLTRQEMIRELQAQGYKITKQDPLKKEQTYPINLTWQERIKGSQSIQFGVVSDTHLGSQKQQLTFLNTFYDYCDSLGITTILHGGDLDDGDGHVYRGQEYDSFIHGYDRHRDYIVEKYPRRTGIKTYVIAGNHDISFHKRGGVDIIADVASKRDDLVYLGAFSAFLTLAPGLKAQLTHGSGGNAYAKSYRLQRLIENFTPENKPECFFLGNYHNWAHVPMVRNVYGWQLGCFAAQTDFEKSKGLFPEIGGLVVTVTTSSKQDGKNHRQANILKWASELIPYYVPRTHDW